MSAGDIILAPHRGSDSEDEDEDEEDLALPAPRAGSALFEALALAKVLASAAWQARLRREDIGRKLAMELRRQPRAVLPPGVAPLLSAAAAFVALAICDGLPLSWRHGSVQGLALRLDVVTLGVLAAIALRQAADRSRQRWGRIAPSAIGLAALGGLAALAVDAAAAGRIAAVAAAAASPWLFTRLATCEASRLAGELRAASIEMADAGAQVSGAMAAARLAFDEELAAIGAGPVLRSGRRATAMPSGAVVSPAASAGAPAERLFRATGEVGDRRFMDEPWREEGRP